MSFGLRRLVVLCVGILPVAALGQRVVDPTAAKTTGVSVFGGYSRTATDFETNTNGFTLGADLTRHFSLLDASLEARYAHGGPGDVVSESNFAGGVKVEKYFHGFRPYVDFLVGEGNITFTHPFVFPTGPYAKDNSIVYEYGAGLDYDVSRHFGVKIDGQLQRWKLGNANKPLSPDVITVGVYYRIPFRPRFGQR